MTTPFDKPRRIALYQYVTGVDYVFISEHFGDNDTTHHSAGVVRISEPVEVSFTPIANPDSMSHALEAEERRLMEDTESKLNRIREKREQLKAVGAA